MSKQASPALIGSFVLGGAALLVIFVLIIAGDRFFKDERRYVIYFEGTIYGLKVGSNVMFRGVPIGYVSDIDVLADFESMDFTVPVTITIIPDSIRLLDPEKGLRSQEDEDIDRLVDKGLRASLASESLITGQLYIEIDFYPGTKAIYRGVDNDLKEIPSTPSGIQEVMEKAQRFVSDIQSNLDVPKLAADITSAIEGLDTLVNNESTQNLTTEFSQALSSTRAAMDNVSDAASSLETAVDAVDGDVGSAILSFTAALDRAEEVLSLAETQLRDDSNIAYRVGVTLKEIEAAARAIRVLAEDLNEQPESILQGKE